jgi:hypothetical protein
MPSCHEVSPADKSEKAALTGLLLAAVVACRSEATLAGKVGAVLRALRLLGLELIRESLVEQDEPFRRETVAVRCPKCRHPALRLKKLKRRSRYTRLGKLTYWRCRYRCTHCEACFAPLDGHLELEPLHRGHSRDFVSELVLWCTVVPFDKGCELFRRAYGFTVSQRLAWGLAFGIGRALQHDELARAAALWKARLTHPHWFNPTPYELRHKDRATRVYVMMDNSKVGIQNGKRGRGARKKPPSAPGEPWRDARALLIFRDTDLAASPSGKRRAILRRRVIAHVGTKEEWAQLVHLALYEEGVYRAREVVIVADGGHGIWELVAELLPARDWRRVVQILDWYHAASHLWTVGKLLKGLTKDGKPSPQCCTWVRGLLEYLYRGEISNVLQRLRKITGGSATARDELRKLIAYYDLHRDRMRYATHRKAGLLLGSGAVESAHQWVIQARCRLPGMRWSVAGINAMLRLRCAWANGRWDEIFAATREARPPNSADVLAAA